MNCLLCEQTLKDRERFSSLFFFRKNSRAICETCQGQFEEIGPRHCPKCCRQGFEEICKDCQIWEQKGYDVSHQALYTYNDAMKDYFSKYKFQGDMLLSKVFAKEVKKVLRTYKDYTIVPIPISQERYQEREFNQVTAILDAAGISYVNLLSRRESRKQSSKTRQERLNNENPFYLTNEQKLPEKILVIDDIYTTGATLEHIYSLLNKDRKKDVKTFSIAR